MEFVLAIILAIFLLVYFASRSAGMAIVRIEAATALGQKELAKHIQSALETKDPKGLISVAEQGIEVSVHNHKHITNLIEPLRGEIQYQQMRTQLIECARMWRSIERGYKYLLRFAKGEDQDQENLVMWLEDEWSTGKLTIS